MAKYTDLHGIEIDWIDVGKPEPHWYNKKQRLPLCVQACNIMATITAR